jgi:hypothetical protein
MQVNVFNLIILDESGSMASIKKAALDGLNETLQSIRNAQKTHKGLQNHYVMLVSFNSAGIRTIFDNIPVSQLRMLTNDDYQPDECTPLYDAMGKTLSGLRRRLTGEVQSQALVTIITDGYENASREYTGKMIKQMVEELKALGWVFVYIGANQDVDAVADAIAINNRMAFDANPSNTIDMMCKEREAREEFYCKVSKKAMGDDVNLFEDFFE